MKLFDTEGNLDYNTARDELAKTAQMPVSSQRVRFDEIGVAALLDIAASLNIVAAEAAFAMPRDLDLVGEVVPFERPDEPRDFLLVGDLVHRVGGDEPGEVTRVGASEGAAWAEVRFAESGDSPRLWASTLVRIVGDEAPEGDEVPPEVVERIADAVTLEAEVGPLVGIATEAETPALLTDADEDGEEAVGGYELVEGEAPTGDVEDDFDEPVNAAEVLAAAEAAKKTRKKGGKK